MNNTKKVTKRYSKNLNIVFISIPFLIGLFTLDIIFKGQVYQRLPERWQNSLSEWTDR